MGLLSPREVGLILVVLFLFLTVTRWRKNGIGTRPRPDMPELTPSFFDKIGAGKYESNFARLPILGDTIPLVLLVPRIYEWIQRIREDAGPMFSVTLPFARFIIIQKPEWIEYVQSNSGNFPNYDKGWLQIGPMKDVLGGGIFASDGAQWHAQRKSTSRIFSANSFRGIIGNTIESHTSTLINVLDKHAETGRAFPLNDLFFRYTLDTFTAMTFGIELDGMQAEKPVPFATAFDYAQHRIDERLFQPSWQLWEPFTPMGSKMRKAIKVLDKFAYDTIDERDRKDAAGEKSTEKGAVDLLSLYRAIRNDKGEAMTRKELRDAVLNLIIAGRDTTAQALSWTFFHVISRPELLKPVREEVERILPNNEPVNYDNFKLLVQANALFMEALRLHPSVPKNGKVVQKDDVIPHGGPTVYAGELVAWSDWALARDTSVWGPDAKELKPSRWIDESGSLRVFDQWKAHMFNGGARICLGKELANFEAVVALVSIVRRFDFAFEDGYLDKTEMTGSIVDTGFPTPVYAQSLTLPMRDAMMVHAKRR